MDLSEKEKILERSPFKVGKVTLTTFNDLERIIGRIEAWQHRPDVPEEVQYKAQQAKQKLMKVLEELEEIMGLGL